MTKWVARVAGKCGGANQSLWDIYAVGADDNRVRESWKEMEIMK